MSDIRSTPLDPDLHKRYWLFTWQEDEASGGLSDFDGAYDTIDDATKSMLDRNDLSHTEGEIFDSQIGKVVSWFSESKWQHENE